MNSKLPVLSPRACCLVVCLCLLLATANAQQSSITVEQNVQVSKALPNDPHFEMQIAADPFHAERLLACSMFWPSDWVKSEVITYASLDGGRSWTPTLRTRADGHHESWDPTCGYGPGGVAYTFSENIDDKDKSFDRLDRSIDGGKTWAPQVRTKHAERNFITVDTTGGKHDGWIYLQGAGRVCVPGQHCLNSTGYYFQYSADNGNTFSSQFVPSSEANYNIGFGPGVVLSDGTYVAPMGEWKIDTPVADPLKMRVPLSVLNHDGRWANTELKVFRATFDKPNWPMTVQVSTVADWFLDRDWNRSMMASMAVDAGKSPFHDRIYLVWPDVGSGRSQILLSYSADKGKTWSKPRVINDDRPRTNGQPGPDDIHGQVAVNPQGVVGVSWYDRRDHPDNLGWTERFRASFDGGETFTPSVRVSEVPYSPDKTDPISVDVIGRRWKDSNESALVGIHSFHFSGGHTAGLAASADGTFHALWVGNSTRVPQLWTAKINVNGEVHKNGSAQLEQLRDASGKVQTYFMNRRLYRADRNLEFDFIIENRSEDTIHGPLKVRVLDLTAILGVPEFSNADEGGKLEGAVFDVSALLVNNELKPHETTKPKHVRIHLNELDPIRPAGPVAVFSLADFTTRVLAGDITGPTADKPGIRPPDGNSPSADPDE